MDGGDLRDQRAGARQRRVEDDVTVPADGGKLTVDVPTLEKHAEPVRPPAPVVTRPTTPIVSDEVTRPAFLTTRRKIRDRSWPVAGALSLVTGIVLGSQAKSKQNAALALCPEPHNCADADGANALKRLGPIAAHLGANILFGVAARGLRSEPGVLWFTEHDAELRSIASRSFQASRRVRPGVVVQGRF